MSLSVGVIGGGQLARMMIAPAVELGIDLRVLAETEGMSAALAATDIGDYHDAHRVLTFARGVDVVTFDHEHVPQRVLTALVDAGVTVRPGPHALQFAQDKLLMRARLAELDVPQPDWIGASDRTQISRFLDAHGGCAVIKTPRGGYDGKGVRLVSAADQADDWLAEFGTILVEERVEFSRELAQQIARRPSGEVRAYPVVETVQRDGVCAEVIAPVPSAAQGTSSRVQRVTAGVGVTIAEGLDVSGMLAVELFETTDERVLVNELAMRPHNSGHWSQDGAHTGQFEQHLRAVLDLPLGDTAPHAAWSVMVNVLGGPVAGMVAHLPAAMSAHPEAKIHSYGKPYRPGRKVGHVTVCGDDLDDVVYRARATAATFAAER